MKATEFRKLIREEVRKALKEVAGKAYALVIDEDGNFMQEDLASYSQDEYVDLDGPKITAAKAAKFPTEYDAWANAPELAKAENQKWLQAISKLGTNYDYYDILSDGGQNAVIAVVPKGSNVEDFAGEMEEGLRKGLREASMNDVPKHPFATTKKATDPVFDFKNNNKPKYPITLDVISMKPIEFGVDYKTPLDLVWLDGLDSPENKYGLSGFTLKTNIPANKQKRITKNNSGTSNYLKSGGY